MDCLVKYTVGILALCLWFACDSKPHGAYGADLAILSDYTQVIELSNHNGNARIAIAPAYQGKIMTSTLAGYAGKSLGWLNRAEMALHPNDNGGSYGGEERLWIGPLGGQFSFYYGQSKPLAEENWQVPAAVGTEPYELLKENQTSVRLFKHMMLVNHVGTQFHFDIDRTITLLSKKEISKNLAFPVSGRLPVVAYETKHKLTSSDSVIWKAQNGLLSLWSMNMLPGTDQAISIIPVKPRTKLNDLRQYMGDLGPDRLVMRDSVVLYKTDGKYRSKIGVPPQYCKNVFGSYDPVGRILHIIQFRFEEKDSMYFNSDVSVQRNPYQGEVIPIYNNGPMDLSIARENSFYELESTSSMQSTPSKPNKLVHWQRVYHFGGSDEQLNAVSLHVLGIPLSKVRME